MGKFRAHSPVKLIVGFIFKDNDCLQKAQLYLTKRFGALDFESGVFAFIHTDYYENEFGKGLLRKFISFNNLIDPKALPSIKILTNKIEQKLSSGSCRRINIDPGYLDLAKLVLATTKDFTHRIYLSHDIYGEVTLFYKNKTFCPWEWTYPDYKTGEYIEVFNKIRAFYEEQAKKIR